MISLTKEEKVACSDLFFVITGVRHAPRKWNAKAALVLYEFIGKIEYCSKAFAFITNLPPLQTKKVTGIALYKVGKYIYKLWEDFGEINNGEYSPMCGKVGRYGRYPRRIEIEMLEGM